MKNHVKNSIRIIGILLVMSMMLALLPIVAVAETAPTPIATYSFEDAENLGDNTAGEGKDAAGAGTGATQAEGKVGNAAEFDGAGGLSVGGGQFATMSSFTLSFWMKPDADTKGAVLTTAEIGYYGGSYTNYVWFPYDATAGNNTVGSQVIWGSYEATPVGAIAAGEWNYVTIVANGVAANGIRIYVNGKLAGNSTLYRPADFVAGICIGGCAWWGALRNDETVKGYEGLLDEFQIYDTALTAAQVAALYAGEPTESEEPPISTAPIATYNFEDAANLGDNTAGEGKDAAGAGTGATQVAGRVGNAAKFDGAGGLSVGGGQFATMSSFTLSFWMKPDADTKGAVLTTAEIGYYGGSYTNYVWFPYDATAGNNTVGSQVIWGSYEATPAGAIAAGEWNHVTIVANGVDANGISIYVNGKLAGNSTLYRPADFVAGICIGGCAWWGALRNDETVKGYEGLLDEFQIYDQALSAQDVVALYASYVDGPETLDGAQARMNEPAGLRFLTKIDKNLYDALVSTYGAENVHYGTLIAPEVYVAQAGAFTKEALDALNLTTAYLDVDGTEMYAEDGDCYVFAGSIVDLLPANYGRDFAAIGYISVYGQITYSTSYTVRNAKEVAAAALADTSDVLSDDYSNEVEAGVYSPYTVAQREALTNIATYGD